MEIDKIKKKRPQSGKPQLFNKNLGSTKLLSIKRSSYINDRLATSHSNKF